MIGGMIEGDIFHTLLLLVIFLFMSKGHILLEEEQRVKNFGFESKFLLMSIAFNPEPHFMYMTVCDTYKFARNDLFFTEKLESNLPSKGEIDVSSDSQFLFYFLAQYIQHSMLCVIWLLAHLILAGCF